MGKRSVSVQLTLVFCYRDFELLTVAIVDSDSVLHSHSGIV